MKLMFFKSQNFPIGHITTTKDGQKLKKVAQGKWVPVSSGTSSGQQSGTAGTGKSISGLTFKDGFYFDGKTKISSDYDKAKKYSDKKDSQSSGQPGNPGQSIKIGDKIRVKSDAKSSGKITEHKGRGIVATVKEIAGDFVKIIDDTGKMFQVKRMALEFAKSGIISVNDYDLIKSDNPLIIFDLIKGKTYPVGTIREWQGKKYQKQSSGKWIKFKEKSEKKTTDDRKGKFKEWFKDSKVIDKKGNPLVVYHGTSNKSFKTFDLNKTGTQTDTGMWGKGFYFSDDKNYATTYKKNGRLLSLYLFIKNPYYIKNKKDIPNIKVPNETIEDLENQAENYSKIFREFLQNKGHDGVIRINEDGSKEYVTFEPNQIKSIDAKEFDNKSNNIYKSKLGIKIEKEHSNTIKKIKKDNLNETQSAKLIAEDHNKEAKEKGYDYYKRLIETESLEDYKGVDKKIIEYIKSHNFIKDEKGIHKFAKELNINPHKLEEKIYAILKKIVGNKIKKSSNVVFNLFKSDLTKLESIKKILLKILDKNMEKSLTLGMFDLLKSKSYSIGTVRSWKNKKFIKISKGKWRRFYEGESRGQKQSIGYIKKKFIL